jgi:hypothetical protein
MKKTKLQFKKLFKNNKNLIIAIAVIAVVITASVIAGGQGDQFQGFLKRPTVRTVRPYTGTSAAYTSTAKKTEPTITAAEFVKKIIDKKKINISSYKGCSAKLANTWMEPYVCYLNAVKKWENIERIDWAAGLNRAEASKALWEIAYSNVPLYSGTNALYPDVSSNQWYYGYIMTLSQLKVVNATTGGTFKPGDMLTIKDADNWISKIK